MPSSDLLDPVWQTYTIAKDCLKIARRVVSAEDLHLISRTGFVGMPVQEAEQEIESSIEAIEDFAIIGFWAQFERHLIEYSRTLTQPLSTQNPAAFSSLLQEKLDTGHWRKGEHLVSI